MMGFDRTPAERAADAASTELQDFLLTIKAKDDYADAAIREYARQLDIQEHYWQAGQALLALKEVNDWRDRNPELCGPPNHEHVPAGQPGSGSEPST